MTTRMSTAVVILNWNGLDFLTKFLEGVVRMTPQASIIVADNGSDDASLEWIAENFTREQVRVITLDKNYGFTGGYNRALAALEGEFDYFLLLNSDIEVTPGWLEPLVEFMDSHPECGACAPKIRSWHDRDCFEHAGAAGGYLDRFFFPYCRGRVMDHVEKDYGQYNDPANCFWVSGAAFMVRSSIWKRLGGLDESFFAHMEEIDFCWRAQLQGWQVWSVPSSVIYHVGGGTLPNNSPRKIYLNFRNNLLMMYKNLPERWRDLLIFERMVIDGVLATIYLFTGKREFFKMVIKAHSDFRKMKKNCVTSERTVNLKRPHGILFIRRFRIFVGN